MTEQLVMGLQLAQLHIQETLTSFGVAEKQHAEMGAAALDRVRQTAPADPDRAFVPGMERTAMLTMHPTMLAFARDSSADAARAVRTQADRNSPVSGLGEVADALDMKTVMFANALAAQGRLDEDDADRVAGLPSDHVAAVALTNDEMGVSFHPDVLDPLVERWARMALVVAHEIERLTGEA